MYIHAQLLNAFAGGGCCIVSRYPVLLLSQVLGLSSQSLIWVYLISVESKFELGK